MAKYFKIVEVDEKEFKNETMEEFYGSELVVSVEDVVYVAIDEEREEEMAVPLDFFE